LALCYESIESGIKKKRENEVAFFGVLGDVLKGEKRVGGKE